MSKRTFLIMLGFLFMLKGFAQEVLPVQASLITKRTATWCPNCGTWGWSLFNNLREQNAGKAVFFAAHYSGDLANTVATQLTANFDAAYQPVFYFNEVNQEALSSNAAAVLNSMKQQVDAAFASPPVANVGFDSSYAGGIMTVQAKVRFFAPADGEFYLGMYLVEDNVVATQAGIGANANHMDVLRSSFSGDTWGVSIGNGTFNAGHEFTHTFSMQVDNPANHDYSLAGVIWKKEGDKYKVVNTWATGIESSTSATTTTPQVLQMMVMPSPVTSVGQVFLQLEQAIPDATLEIVDTRGAVAAKLFRGQLDVGQKVFELNKNQLGNGLYFVRLTWHGGMLVEKVIIQ